MKGKKTSGRYTRAQIGRTQPLALQVGRKLIFIRYKLTGRQSIRWQNRLKSGMKRKTASGMTMWQLLSSRGFSLGANASLAEDKFVMENVVSDLWLGDEKQC